MASAELLREALAVVESMQWPRRERQHAVQAALLAHARPSGAPTGACKDLEHFYAMLSHATNVQIARPTAAAALLRHVGLADFTGRASKLSSRRKHEAHPDATFLLELQSALDRIGAQTLSQLGASFRSAAPGKPRGDLPVKSCSTLGVANCSDVGLDGTRAADYNSSDGASAGPPCSEARWRQHLLDLEARVLMLEQASAPDDLAMWYVGGGHFRDGAGPRACMPSAVLDPPVCGAPVVCSATT